MPLAKSGEDNQWFSQKEYRLRGLFPHWTQLFNILFSWHSTSKERQAPYCCLFHTREVLIFLVFPHDYICAFLIVWKSNHLLSLSYFNNRTTSFLIKFKPFPELTNILLREQCKTSGGCWNKHKLRATVYSLFRGFWKSIPQTINSPCS